MEAVLGKNCETDIAECEQSPCQNGAACVEKSNSSLYEMGLVIPGLPPTYNFSTAGGYLCLCLPGFSGDDCEVNIDECASKPCKNGGTCVDGINDYTCQCWPGYEGEHCQTEIDEFVRLQPCHRGVCQDRVADYVCECEDGFGGKNCSVALLGCRDVTCLSGGTCQPFVVNETEHMFRCRCPPGFYGDLCEKETTASFQGASHVRVSSPSDADNYTLSLRFRTTLPDGLLLSARATPGGDSFFRLRLSGGAVNLFSSMQNALQGLTVGAALHDAAWHHVLMAINGSTAALSVDGSGAHEPLRVSSSDDTRFASTMLGHAAASHLQLFVNTSGFVGCMQDIMVDGGAVVPSMLREDQQENLTLGCPREEQCSPNPCMNAGACVDLWSRYRCDCVRPFLGPVCDRNITAATFNHENSSGSLVSVAVEPAFAASLTTFVDISLFARTRQPDGMLFYLGTDVADVLGAGGITYLAAELSGGLLQLRLKLAADREELLEVPGPRLDDGVNNLVRVVRNDTMRVLVNGAERANIINGAGQTRLVEFYPLNDPSLRLPPPLGLVTADRVLAGSVSDDTCRDGPCSNNGTCAVTWNDFSCTCPEGYKGRTCTELEYCVWHECPGDSTCHDLADGHECVANATFNGVNSSVAYAARLSAGAALDSISVAFRSRAGGLLLSPFRGCLSAVRLGGVLLPFLSDEAVNSSAADRFAVRQPMQFVAEDCTLCYQHECQNGGACAAPADEFDCTCPAGFNGTTCQNNIDECLLGNECTNGATCVDGVDGYSCACVGGYVGEHCETEVDECASLPCQHGATCVDRINNYTCVCTDEYIGRDCEQMKVVNCTHKPCQNSGVCVDVFDGEVAVNYTCACPFGFEGRDCELVTDFCQPQPCLNDGTCSSNPGVGYTCQCALGFEGDDCEINIDECASTPCQNGGTCLDQVNSFVCSCPSGWTGRLCDTDTPECQFSPCQNGGNCTELPGSFECTCLPEFCGRSCDLNNHCVEKVDDCKNGGVCVPYCDGDRNNYSVRNTTCMCFDGYYGPTCEDRSRTGEIMMVVAPVLSILLLAAIVGMVIFTTMAKNKRATRGTYSPSRQEMFNPRVEMGNMKKPPPEERLI
ncbi:LOW QUALITY PROTEIN: protein crumbs-like [Pollicipes pollicipes]|uniref:LOW QUALITY PROTEIN: protein crumbs-like n=1 Tax=Pollicipes pollicipes TaxID=41117 RepID=UPI0018856EEF|nr:LOW QUALITY PROTEIN: protein crumbs-like [Pollicipes pollicipes]